MPERWIPAPGFTGYEVSTAGRVRNAETRRVLHHATKLYPTDTRPGHLQWLPTGENRKKAAAAQRRELGRVRRGWAKRRGRGPVPADLVRRLLAVGVAGADIARALKISPSTVSRIRNGSRRVAQ